MERCPRAPPANQKAPPQAPGLTHLPPSRSAPGAPQGLKVTRSHRARWCSPVLPLQVGPRGANARALVKRLEQVRQSPKAAWHTDTLLSGLLVSFLPSPQLSLQPRCPFTGLGVPALCRLTPRASLITLYGNYINY